MLGPHSATIRCAIRVGAECLRPRFLLGRVALLFRLWQAAFGLRHNGRQRCWATSRGLSLHSQRSLASQSTHHRNCSSGGMPMKPMNHLYFGKPVCFAGTLVVIAGSLWRARQIKLVTTYGSAHWANLEVLKSAKLFSGQGVFSGSWGNPISVTMDRSMCWPLHRHASAKCWLYFILCQTQ